MTHTPTSVDDLRAIGLSERDAFVAAAILPRLPDGDVLVRIKEDDEAPPNLESDPHVLKKFEDDTPTVGATSNLRRCRYQTPPGHGDFEAADVWQLVFTPAPHSTRSYTLSLYEVDMIQPPEDADFDFGNQSTLTRWVDSVTFDVDPAAVLPYDWPREPTCPPPYDG